MSHFITKGGAIHWCTAGISKGRRVQKKKLWWGRLRKQIATKNGKKSSTNIFERRIPSNTTMSSKLLAMKKSKRWMIGGDFFHVFLNIGWVSSTANFICAGILLWNVTTLHWSSFAKAFTKDQCHLTPKFFAKSPKDFCIFTQSNAHMEIWRPEQF